MNIIINYIKSSKNKSDNGNSKLSEELYNRTLSSLKINYQWENFIFLKDLPLEWKIDELRENLVKEITNNRGRILNPLNDVFIFKNPDFKENSHLKSSKEIPEDK